MIVGGIYYKVLSEEDLTCEVTHCDQDTFVDSSYTDIVVPSIVTYNDKTYTVVAIGNYAFCNCSKLTSINIPNSVTTIGNYAFSSCFKLTSFEIPNSVTTIGKKVFSNCKSLMSIVISNSVTAIGDAVFFNCSNLTSITLPNSVTSIGYSAFQSCRNLTSIDIPNSVTTIENFAFTHCSKLTSIEVPNSVTIIGNLAFSSCSKLTLIEIPNSITTLGENPFNFCSNLKSFMGKFASDDHRCLIVDGVLNSFAPAELTTYTIPNSVTMIGNYAFSNCNNLISIGIPDHITTIGWCAFQYCSNLNKIISLAVTPPSVEEKTFYNFPKSTCTLKVPKESVEAYKSAKYWKDFQCIVALTDEERQILPIGSISDTPTVIASVSNTQRPCVGKNHKKIWHKIFRICKLLVNYLQISKMKKL